MRLGLLVIVLAACSSHAAARPTWPKPAAREVDGGESLAPRAAARAIAARAEADKPVDRPAGETPAPAASATGAADQPVGPAVPADPSDDEAVMTEDMVIEIED